MTASAPEQPVVRQFGYQLALEHDEDGTERQVDLYTIDGAPATVERYEAARLEQDEAMRLYAVAVSRYLEERQREQDEAAAVEQEDEAREEATRRDAAESELAALGLSPETVQTIVRGM